MTNGRDIMIYISANRKIKYDKFGDQRFTTKFYNDIVILIQKCSQVESIIVWNIVDTIESKIIHCYL